MWKSTHLKLLLSLCLFWNYSPTILADGLISKSNSRANGNEFSTKENQWKINRPKEIWIVVNEISCWESNGRWENVTVCSNTTIVKDHRFRFLSRTGLTGIQLKCKEKYGADETDEVLEMISKDEVEINLPRGEWENWSEESCFRFAVGFAFAPGEMNLRRSVKNFDMIYQSENKAEVEKQWDLDSNSGRVVTKCPENHAICGLTAMTDKTGLGILTGIGLKCCFHCVPKDQWEIVYQRNNTRPCKVKEKFNATVSVQRSVQDFISESTKSGKTAEISRLLEQAKMFAYLGKISSTDFDWAKTANLIWTHGKGVTEEYICPARSSCVISQLVGQSESSRVLIQKFRRDSTPIESSSSESWIDPQSIFCCSDAMEISPSPRPTSHLKYSPGNSTSFQVLCDFQVDGGGWTIIQKRTSGPEDEFDRDWAEYANGFGSTDGYFWLGLENIHALTKNGDQELRIELKDFKGEKVYAKYSSFSVSDASDFYRLNIRGFSSDSTAGDSMTNGTGNPDRILNGIRFSTKDKDNDLSEYNCAGGGKGGWWYNQCSSSSLNRPGYRLTWESWKVSFSQRFSKFLEKTEMKIRTRKSE